MARGYDRHQARKAELSGLGRGLSRRAGNRCELCRDATSLKVVEVEPTDPEEVSEDRAVMVCARCAGLMDGDKADAVALRFLEESIWAEVLPVQLAAIRLTRGLAEQGVPWAREALDGLYLDPEIEELL